jgi:hypothetical protein
MHAVLMTLLLVGGGPYMAAAEDYAPAAPEQYAGGPCRGANSPPGPVVDLRQAASAPVRSWGAYFLQSDYSPGCLRDPMGSWFKHPYLAYRGNYYRQGFDYYRQLDYPWHKPHAPARGVAVPRPLPHEGEPLPVPAEPQAARPRSNQPTAVVAKPKATILENRR